MLRIAMTLGVIVEMKQRCVPGVEHLLRRIEARIVHADGPELTLVVDLNENLDEGTLGQLSLFDGDFTINVTDESGRINVNFCAHRSVGWFFI